MALPTFCCRKLGSRAVTAKSVIKKNPKLHHDVVSFQQKEGGVEAGLTDQLWDV